MKPPRTPDSMEENGLRVHLQQVNKVVGGNISHGASMNNTDLDRNIDCSKHTGTAPGVADTEFSIVHTLGRIPLTIGGQDTNNGGVLYRSATAWTATTAFLKCTKASSVYNVILV